MLKKGLPVFFGSDVGQQSDSQKGIMDTDLVCFNHSDAAHRILTHSQVDYELGFNVKLGMSKAERLIVGSSQMTHAMV